MNCDHTRFHCSCQVVRLTDSGDPSATSFAVRVGVTCADCGRRFGFLGPPAGLLNDAPTASADGFELSCPIVPGAVPRVAPGRVEYPRRPTREPDDA